MNLRDQVPTNGGPRPGRHGLSTSLVRGIYSRDGGISARAVTAWLVLAVPLTLSAEERIAFDMVASGSDNLIEHANGFEGAFVSPGDGFQKYQRGVSSTIPFSVLDDSLSIFTADSLGIIDENNLDTFFGSTDTLNNDNPSGDVLATWEFDISGGDQLGVSIDMGAMGDFEAGDIFTWSASIDGGPEQVLFSGSADEDASLTYSLSGGAAFTLDDPMLVDGVPLTNVLTPFRSGIAGAGERLLLTLRANTDGGSEAFAFQNLVVFADFEEEPAAPTIARIHEVQGAGDVSPLDGEEVSIEAVVVGDFQNNGSQDSGDLNGFFLQEEDTDIDGDSATSEGVFIYYPGALVDVTSGDLARVTGTVSEFGGMTQVSASSVEILASGLTLPAATPVELPVSGDAEFESKEGMRVRFPQALVISEYFNFDRFGEIVLARPLAGEERPMTPTAVEVPGSNGFLDRADLNLRSRITLDDGRTSSNPDPAIHPNGGEFGLSNRFRGGDLVSDATGVLSYAFGRYRLQPTEGAGYTAANPRPESAPEVGGAIRVAAFNVLNYFTSLDLGDDVCGPAANLECRGADNDEEFQRQRAKIVAAIAEMDADVVGLIELENNDGEAVGDLVSGLNELLGAGTYAAVTTGFIGGDAIKVGFIYQPGSVSPDGPFAVLDSNFDGDFLDDRNRPALAQTFSGVEGGRFTAVVNHFKSKGSDCNDIGDPDQGDGQGNCNGTRADAARVLAEWLATDPTGSGDPDQLIIGDLNAYDKEDPVRILEEAGYVDLVAAYGGEFAYSYVFDGQFGYLDYALANRALAGQVTGTAVWHINADEPDILDYDTSFKKPAQAALFEENAFRSSDHDPVIVGLTLFAEPDAKDDCKADGWQLLRRADGSPFSNQGQCIRYYNTGQ